MGINPYFRMQNIFGGQPNTGVQLTPFSQPTQPVGKDIFASAPIVPDRTEPDELESLVNFNPEHEASDRVNSMLGTYPVRPHPNILRRIGAALTRFSPLESAPEARMRMLYGDYPEKVQDWEKQFGAAREAANLERYSNVNERQTAYNLATTKLGLRKLKETERKDLEAEKDRDVRNQAYVFKQMNPNHKYEVRGTDGHMIATDPLTNEQTDLGKWQYSESDKYNLLHGQRMEEIGARTEGAIRTKAAPTAASKLLSPTQDRVLEQQAYNNYIQNKQPGWDQIKFNPDSKTWDATGIEDPDVMISLMTYIKNYKANFRASGAGTPGPENKPPKPGYVPKLDANGKQIGWTWGGK